jgi:hypothetical protein
VGILPIILTVISTMIWILVNMYLLKKKKQLFDLVPSVKLTFLIIVYFLQPQLISSVFSLFQCMPLPSSPHSSFLMSDFRSECWNYDHLSYSLGLSVPIFGLWVISLNVHLHNQIKRKGLELSNEEVIKEYGLFYVGLRDQSAPYWEVFISLFRKIIFIGISTFIATSSNDLKVNLIL